MDPSHDLIATVCAALVSILVLWVLPIRFGIGCAIRKHYSSPIPNP